MKYITVKLTEDQVRCIEDALGSDVRSHEFVVDRYTKYPTREAAREAGKSWTQYIYENLDHTKSKLAFAKRILTELGEARQKAKS